MGKAKRKDKGMIKLTQNYYIAVLGNFIHSES